MTHLMLYSLGWLLAGKGASLSSPLEWQTWQSSNTYYIFLVFFKTDKSVQENRALLLIISQNIRSNSIVYFSLILSPAVSCCVLLSPAVSCYLLLYFTVTLSPKVSFCVLFIKLSPATALCPLHPEYCTPYPRWL